MLGIRTCSLHLSVLGTYRSGTVLESNQFPQTFLFLFNELLYFMPSPVPVNFYCG